MNYEALRVRYSEAADSNAALLLKLAEASQSKTERDDELRQVLHERIRGQEELRSVKTEHDLRMVALELKLKEYSDRIDQMNDQARFHTQRIQDLEKADREVRRERDSKNDELRRNAQNS